MSVYSDRSFALAGLEIGVQQDDTIRCIGNAAVGMAFVPAARFFPDHAFFRYDRCPASGAYKALFTCGLCSCCVLLVSGEETVGRLPPTAPRLEGRWGGGCPETAERTGRLSAKASEKTVHQLGAFFGQYAAAHFRFGMVRRRDEASGASFGIVRAVDDFAELTPEAGSGAHRTGFDGDVEPAFVQVFSAHGSGRSRDGLHFGMRRRVGERLHQIVPSAYDPVAEYDHRTDGHFARIEGFPCFGQCLPHESFVFCIFFRHVRSHFLPYPKAGHLFGRSDLRLPDKNTNCPGFSRAVYWLKSGFVGWDGGSCFFLPKPVVGTDSSTMPNAMPGTRICLFPLCKAP